MNMTILSMPDLPLSEQRVLIREDFNVPLNESGQITSDLRIQSALPTLRYALSQGAAVIVLSHLGRPIEGQCDPQYSLAPVAKRLEALLKQPVRFEKNYLSGLNIAPGELVLCENVRFNLGENDDDETLSKRYAQLADVFVMDAFATAHRAQASTHGVALCSTKKCAGFLLQAELNALGQASAQAKPPVLAIVGGSKVSTKFMILSHLVQTVDHLIVGGGIANTFLAAIGLEVGASLYEKEWLTQARELLQTKKIILPVDVRTAKTFSPEAAAEIKTLQSVVGDDRIFDIGPETEAKYAALIQQANTIIWNGPVGVFEFSAFASGTRALAQSIASSTAFSLAGGGDTIAAIEQNGVADRIGYISTAGGAFLEFLEGRTLPGIEALNADFCK